MKIILAAALLLVAWSPAAVGQTKSRASARQGRDERALLRANREYDEALVRGDAEALERIYADEFVYTTFDGEVRDKAQQIAFTRSGELKLESGRSDDVRVRVYGNTAVMTGRFTAKGKFRGAAIDVHERYTAVWVRSRGRWRLVAEQGNEIKRQ